MYQSLAIFIGSCSAALVAHECGATPGQKFLLALAGGLAGAFIHWRVTK